MFLLCQIEYLLKINPVPDSPSFITNKHTDVYYNFLFTHVSFIRFFVYVIFRGPSIRIKTIIEKSNRFEGVLTL